MQSPDINPDVADDAPTADAITAYDEAHFVTYLRLLDAEADGADWREVARIVLYRDPVAEPDHTRRCWLAHLGRAKWMTERGYRHLLEGGGEKVRRDQRRTDPSTSPQNPALRPWVLRNPSA